MKVVWFTVGALVVIPLVWLDVLFIFNFMGMAMGAEVATLLAIVLLLILPATGKMAANWKSWAIITAQVAITLTVTFVAFRNARSSGQAKAVLGNARQQAAAADQYFQENGVSTARYEDLVGLDKYIKGVNYVAGETYPKFYTQGVTITITGVAGTMTVTYAP